MLVYDLTRFYCNILFYFKLLPIKLTHTHSLRTPFRRHLQMGVRYHVLCDFFVVVAECVNGMTEGQSGLTASEATKTKMKLF